MTIAYGVRAIAAETGVDSRGVAILAREGYPRIIFSLLMVEQRRRRNTRPWDEFIRTADEIT